MCDGLETRWIGDGLETLSGHSGSDNPLRVKGLAALAFFLVFTVLIATGMVLGVHGNSKGWWMMVASLVAYLGFFIKKGCLTQAH
jgi:Ni,Fe-hydrogenase I cytochrome b subunit